MGDGENPNRRQRTATAEGSQNDFVKTDMNKGAAQKEQKKAESRSVEERRLSGVETE